MIVIVTYTVYVIISLAVTIWVARTLHKNGRAFLIDAFKDNIQLADSVNHLLVVGFYLVNLGYVSWVLKLNIRPEDAATAIEQLSAKLGLVLITLGIMHFMNIFIFSRVRKNALFEAFMPPVTPDAALTQKG